MICPKRGCTGQAMLDRADAISSICHRPQGGRCDLLPMSCPRRGRTGQAVLMLGGGRSGRRDSFDSLARHGMRSAWHGMA